MLVLLRRQVFPDYYWLAFRVYFVQHTYEKIYPKHIKLNDTVYVICIYILVKKNLLAQPFKANEPSGEHVLPSSIMLMKVLSGTSCVTRSTMLVLWHV